ncbi:MAG: condensation domain-containing protein, partial [Gemmatimonadaceae bacterium]
MNTNDSSATMLPASFAQELLWLIDRASPGSIAYNVPRTRRLAGPLNVAALRQAFNELVARHEILRTTYATHEGQNVQVIHAPQDVPFDVVDLIGLAAAEREAEALRVLRERSARPFDLAVDMMLRVTLVRFDDTDHLLLFESHHIAFDGWSRDVVFRDLAALYDAASNNRAAELPALPIQYADYAIWQQEQLAGARLDSLLSYWRNELGDAEHVLHLPTDLPRPAVSKYEGISHAILLPTELRDGLRALGQRHNATPYMVVLAAYATVLHRYSGQSDVLVGSPMAGRTNSDTEGLIGYFANTIVQRARFANDPTFGALLDRIRESALGAYDHQDVPFEKLVIDLEGRSNLGQSPLFQVVLTQLDTSQNNEARMGDITLAPYSVDVGATKFDLTLFMADRVNGLGLSLRGRSDLHHAESIERLLGHVESVIRSAVANDTIPVSQIPLQSESERAALAAFNNTAVNEGPSATVVSLFETVAHTAAARTAVVGQQGSANTSDAASLSYADVNARANKLAHLLNVQGVARGSNVGLLLDRSADAIIGMLGIMKAGAAYVPLSLDAPASRVAAQLAECNAKIVVTGSQSVALPTGVEAVALDFDSAALRDQSDQNPAIVAQPGDRAYVLFTSGSTGVPKGVAVTHANIV